MLWGMGYRQTEFAVDEWYHCYTRSIDKQVVFKDVDDYNRFLESLYLCNGSRTLLRGALYRPSHEHLLSLKRGEPLVAIGAYCLMPNHFHLLLRQIAEGGISTFMQKMGTSFSMYYNLKYEHVGNVFIKPFRAKHVGQDDYFQRVIQYIHLNPAEIFEPQWKEGTVGNMKSLSMQLGDYRYSSLADYLGTKRPENTIIDSATANLFESPLSLEGLLHEAAEYYRELNL